MGSAILGGVISSGIAEPEDITVSDKNADLLDKINAQYSIEVVQRNADCLECDVLFLCVKPNALYSVIDEIREKINPDTVIVSIVAGQSMEKISNTFERPIKLVRVMPNTPALVGEGMAAVCINENVSDKEADSIISIFNSLGKAEVVSEQLMDTVTGVSGSSPAYVFMFIEAMADAAVKGGMTREMAYTFAAQSVLGSAKMVLETKKHPGELKDMVCSPGGTTIDAVSVLESEGMRSAVIKAIDACINKSKSM